MFFFMFLLLWKYSDGLSGQDFGSRGVMVNRPGKESLRDRVLGVAVGEGGGERGKEVVRQHLNRWVSPCEKRH